MPTRGIYLYSLLRRNVQIKVHGRLGNIASGDTGSDTNLERDLINSAVRIAMSDIDFRGNIREALLTPNLMDNQYDYAMPVDVKGDKIIDLRPQNTDSRGEFETYNLTTPEEFDRRKKTEKGIYTILNDDLTRILRVSADIEDETLTISELDGINNPDTWEGIGGTADTDLDTETDDYIQGNGAVRFSDTRLATASGLVDTIVGIENRNIEDFDISPYLSRGSFFVYGKLDTGDSGIKSINIRLGSDSDNYYTFTDSTQNDCSAFQAGWNLARMDASSRVTTGTPADTAIDYAAIFWGRDSATHLDTDFAFDYLIAKKGKYYNLSYYSRYVWQDTALTLAENSTNDSHALLLQNDEVELVAVKAAELASQYLRDDKDQAYYANEYTKLKFQYLLSHPSQASVLTTTRYDFGSLEDAPNTNDS